MEHQHRTLAKQGVTQIEQCGCGMLSVGIGPVTVKLSPQAFAQLVDGIREADRKLQGYGPPAEVVPLSR